MYDKLITPELERMLVAQGLNYRRLLDCLKEQCRRSQGALGGEQPYDPNAIAIVPVPSLTGADLRSALLALQQQAAVAPSQFAEVVKGHPRPKTARLSVAAARLQERPRPFLKEPPAAPKRS